MVGGQHPSDGQQARVPAGLEPLEDPRLKQGGEGPFACLLVGVEPVPARAVAGHLEALDPGGDLDDEPRVVFIQAVSLGRQTGLRKADRGAVREGGARVPRLDEAAVPAHADHVRQRKENVGIEVLRVALVGSRLQEEPAQRADPVRREGPVVPGERQDHVVEVPQAVVDRRRG